MDEFQLALFSVDMLSTEKIQETLHTIQQGGWRADRSTHKLNNTHKFHFQRDAPKQIPRNPSNVKKYQTFTEKYLSLY